MTQCLLLKTENQGVGGNGKFMGNETRGLELFCGGGGTEVHLHSKSLYQIGGWTQVLQTWDGEMLKLYINGILDTKIKAPGPLATGDSPVIIGRLGAYAFIGSMDDVRIYNRALSSEEIKALYTLEHFQKPKEK